MNDHPRHPRRPDLLLSDLTSELLWPCLFRAGTLAFRPGRLLIAFVTLVLIGLIGSLSRIWSEAPSFADRVGQVVGGVFRSIGASLDGLNLARPWDLPLGEAGAAGFALVLSAPVVLLREYPVSFFLLGLPMLGVALVGWGAISRSASIEFALDVPESDSTSLARALRSLAALLQAFLGPILIAGLVALVLGSIAWILFSLPVVDLLGAVLFGLGVIVALLLVTFLSLWLASLPILPAAVMCEGPDVFDAVQRGLAYVVRKPLRYALYLLVLVAVGAVLTAIVSLLLYAADRFATGASVMFLSPEYAEKLSDPTQVHSTLLTRILGFWRSMLQIALGAFVFSYVGSASAVLYLLMRKLVDGQTPADMPKT